MDDSLIDDDDLSLSRKSRLPGAGFFYPDSLDEEYADRRAREAIEGAETVVVADGDADGLGCVALLREVYDAALDVAPFEESLAARTDPTLTDDEDEDEEDREESPVGLVTASPHSLDAALERVAAYVDPGVDVYVCDLCPDDAAVIEVVEQVVARAETVRWFDHHQWDDEIATAVREAGVDLVVGESDEECTADVALRSLDYDFPDHLVDLAAVTRDHDLWIKEDPRSDDLADYSHWASAEEYVTVVGQYGPALPDPVVDYLDHRRVEKENLIEAAIDRADLKSVGPWTVGVTYGRCSQNEVAEALRERGADAAVIVKPAGSASIRGSEGFERAHEVAGLVNGGGHPRAAGCKPDIYDDMLDYAHHWTTEGATTKQVILAAFERVASEAE
ncbi:DHH family phosphoesterase [Haloplanus aerogenes]|uniref:Oligoribonuclease NrnB/cAMP/cGMP phosphodiesterase (DHH superfamily) n=1 Tax=Haloplanus aerogenes TaxID=660522 RepID=A0A3M0DRF9_9EURY|nr:phosphohydrolase [Haloplanus aerogenes]AZH24322.1 phosphohydrolase [Haloplanus aerogenes]RMB24044.1 oligoribonuclease NrnB/cAMP/cGMP phosphodiesterase (DHH superfamily) [Haloplanus aerogenes]